MMSQKPLMQLRVFVVLLIMKRVTYPRTLSYCTASDKMLIEVSYF